MADFVPVAEADTKEFVPVEEVKPEPFIPVAEAEPRQPSNPTMRAAIPAPGQPGSQLGAPPLSPVPQAFPGQEQNRLETSKLPAPTAEELEQEAFTPRIDLGRRFPEGTVKRAAENILKGIPEFLSSPLGIFAPAIQATPAGPALDAVMGYSMAKSGSQKIGEAWETGNRQTLAEGIGELILGGAAGVHGLNKGPLKGIKADIKSATEVPKPNISVVDREARAGMTPKAPEAPSILPEAQAELNKIPGGNDALQIGSAAKVPLEEAPGRGPEVGARVSEPETSSLPQVEREQQPQPAAQEVSPVRDVASESTPVKEVNPTNEEKVIQKEGLQEVTQPSLPPESSAGKEVIAGATTEAPPPPVEGRGATPETPPAEPIGMGGAVPSEFAPTHTKVTGIKNASVDLQRAERGLEPIMKPLRETWQDAWDRAMAKMDADQTTASRLGVQDRLIKELSERPRTATTEENVMLAQRMADMRNEFDKARRAELQAYDDGRIADAEASAARAEEWSQKLSELEAVTEAAGTWAGKNLNARKIMLADDFTLAKMERDLRLAQDKKPLNQRDKVDIKTISDRVKTLEDKLAKTEKQLEEANQAKTQAETPKPNKDGSIPIPEHIMRIVKRVGEVLDRRADLARERLKGKLFTLSPDVLKDLAEVGASNIYHIGLDFGKWSLKMIEDIGERVKPHLKLIYEASQKLMDETATLVAKGDRVTKKRVKETALNPEERRLQTWKKATATRIKAYEERTAAGDFEIKRREAVKLDKEAQELKYRLEKTKREWHEKVFERKLANESGARKAIRRVMEASNAIRSLLTSMDLSAVLRQGKFAGIQHPIIAARNILPMLRSFASEKAAFRIEREVERRENAPRYKSSKLAITEQGSILSKMEEAYMGRWTAKIPLVKASARAYTTFLNKLRADAFDALTAMLEKKGAATPEQDRIIANAVNVFTGRGTIGMAEQAATGLNTFFFAPKFVASRFQTILGQPLYFGTFSGKAPFSAKGALAARKLVALEYGKLIAGYAAIYALANAAGYKIGTDPNSTDFGKIIVGKTRIDPLAGLSQITVLMSRLITGKKTTQAGRSVPIRGKVPFGGATSADVVGHFLRQKLAPVPSLAMDVATGSDLQGKPLDKEWLLRRTITPISFQDIYEASKEQGVPGTAALSILSILGENVQTYEDKPKARTQRVPLNP